MGPIFGVHIGLSPTEGSESSRRICVGDSVFLLRRKGSWALMTRLRAAGIESASILVLILALLLALIVSFR
jgi:hypothetical protein